MNNYEYLKPKYRSKIRLFIGKKYYICKRYINWYFTNTKYASIDNKLKLSETIFTHKTPLYRKLKNVDMWMQDNKVENLKIAIKQVNKVVIRPGETFSYWKAIGRPTASKGYKEGMVLNYGKFKAGVGGGLCQLSNMLYWMTLHTPLTVVERHRHGFDVFPDSKRTQPFGSGATCVYNYRDLQILNETNETYQFNVYMDESYLIGEINSNIPKYFTYELYEEEHSISHEFWGAYIRHNEIRRKVYDIDNVFLDDEEVCKNHALMMYEPLLEYKD